MAVNNNVHDITLSHFIFDAGDGPPMADAMLSEIEQRNMIDAAWIVIQEDAGYCFDRRAASKIPGFSIAHNSFETIMIWEEANRQVVGGLGYGVPFIAQEHRNKKLGREIYRVAFENGIKKMSNTHVVFSESGLATRKSYHRYAVETALQNGYNVPEEVLKDYPDLYQEIKFISKETEDA